MIEADLRLERSGFTLAARFTAPAEGVTGLVGPSGAGKSSLLLALAGLLSGVQGRLALGGRVLQDDAARVRLPPERRRIAIVFQDLRLFPHLDVRGNLKFGLTRRPAGLVGPALDDVAERLGLAPLLRRRPHTLSGGEARRVALGRALLVAPALLALDEPLAGLDAARRGEALDLLAGLAAAPDGPPMLLVSHQAAEIVRLCDHLLVMEAGRLIDQGPLLQVAGRRPGLLGEAGDPCSLLEGTVSDHQPHDGVTRIALGAGTSLLVPLRADRAVGTRVRLLVRARDVALALPGPLPPLSILNDLPARILSVGAAGPGAGTVEVSLILSAGAELRAWVSRLAVTRLGLLPGMEVRALVKAASVAVG